MLYVVGGMEENEMLLYHVVLALRDSLQILLKYVTPELIDSRGGGRGVSVREADDGDGLG